MENLSKDLLRVSRKAHLCAGKIVEKYHLSLAEEPFFMAITFHDGATQEELTEVVGVDKAMTTRVIHSLVKKGLVKKIPDTEDRRCNRIYQTEKMKAITASVTKELHLLDQQFTAGIENDILDTFVQTLSVLEENITGILEKSK
ncbi:MAG: MarR family transcriptional regulator [Blautia sp.]|nr:MarR family transcriptional regulator [uncultured Blautia sp.]